MLHAIGVDRSTADGRPPRYRGRGREPYDPHGSARIRTDPHGSARMHRVAGFSRSMRPTPNSWNSRPTSTDIGNEPLPCVAVLMVSG